MCSSIPATATILGLTLGLSIMAAQHVGAGRRERIRGVLSSFLPLLFAGYGLVALGASFFLEPVLALMDTPMEIFADALAYLHIILLGVPFLACYNLYAALLRALGNTKAAFMRYCFLPVSTLRWISCL